MIKMSKSLILQNEINQEHSKNKSKPTEIFAR
jgi:hypothetical protein